MKWTKFLMIAAMAMGFAGTMSAFDDAANQMGQDTLQDTAYLKMVERSDSAIAAGDYLLAQRLLTDAMNLRPTDPHNAMLLSNLGVIRSRMDDYDGAMQALNEAHAIMPNSVTVLLNRARINMTHGKREESIRDYEEIMRLDSTLVEPYFYRGLSALAVGDIVQTDKDFAMLKRIAPDNELTVHAQAITYAFTGQNRQAADCYKVLVGVDPSAQYYSGLVENLIACDDFIEASAALVRAIELYPADPDFYVWRAVLNKKLYRIDDAKADAARAVQLGASKEEVNAILNAF